MSKKEIEYLKSFGSKIRELRLKKGWTLEQAEEKGWPNWRHLQKIEAGKNITLVTLYRIAKLYEVNIKDIFSLK